MIPVYCITLRQSPERTRLAQQHFDECGLNVTMFPGIHAPTFGLVTEKKANPRKDDYIIAPGQVGCLLSHYMLWQTLQFLPHEEVLIIEDDAVFCADFAMKFECLKNQLPVDWQFCYVGHGNERTSIAIEPTKYEAGTHAYMVKKNALETLLATNQEARTHCDIQIGQNSLPHLNSYRMCPSLVGQRTQQKDAAGNYVWLTTTNNLAHTDATVQGALKFTDKAKEDLYWRIRSKLLPNLGGWCHEVKAVRMAELIIQRQPKICVEIGVFQGKSLFTMAMALRFVGSGKAWGIDPWTQDDSLEGMAEGVNKEWWRSSIDHEHFYLSTADYRNKFELADWCEIIRTRGDCQSTIDMFEDGSIEMFHLDGNHGPQSLIDVKLWLPKLSKDCIVVFDDANWVDGGVQTTGPAINYLIANGFEDRGEAEKVPADCLIMRRLK